MDGENADNIGNIADERTLSAEEILMTAGTQVLVREHLKCLEPREADVINKRFGIGCSEHTLEEIGQIYGVTRERIRQIETKAMEKLGHPARIKRLRSELP